MTPSRALINRIEIQIIPSPVGHPAAAAIPMVQCEVMMAIQIVMNDFWPITHLGLISPVRT